MSHLDGGIALQLQEFEYYMVMKAGSFNTSCF